MFPFQVPMPDYPEHPRGQLKRYHDDEASAELANGTTIGFTEHRNKRLHTLPFRTSPTARQWTLPGAPVGKEGDGQSIAITPPSSYSEELPSLVAQQYADAFLMQQQQQQQQQQAGQFYGSDVAIPSVVTSADMDMDMSTDEAPAADMGYYLHAPLSDNCHLVPGSLQPDHIEGTLAGRIPTPIQPSFAAQVRGGNHMAGSNNGMGGIASPRLLEQQQASMASDWNMVQNRSLPSPISECGVEERERLDAIFGNGDLQQSEHMDHLAAHNRPVSPAHPERPIATPTTPSSRLSPSAMEALHAAMAAETLSSCGGGMDTDLAATPSPKKGHSRSRHTLVAWTQQPGMKKSFSIGYRNDCEKCRNRVPGHFNHIIVS